MDYGFYNQVYAHCCINPIDFFKAIYLCDMQAGGGVYADRVYCLSVRSTARPQALLGVWFIQSGRFYDHAPV